MSPVRTAPANLSAADAQLRAEYVREVIALLYPEPADLFAPAALRGTFCSRLRRSGAPSVRAGGAPGHLLFAPAALRGTFCSRRRRSGAPSVRAGGAPGHLVFGRRCSGPGSVRACGARAAKLLR